MFDKASITYKYDSFMKGVLILCPIQLRNEDLIIPKSDTLIVL